jgi:hypothetical protein
VGTLKPSSGRRLGQPLTGLDTPTLKGLWQTAPYLHDGSAATLTAVLTTANPSGRHGDTASLSTTERQQLEAYLRQIDDSGAGVVFHEHSNFGGAAGQPLARGDYTLAQLQALGVQNDWASSVRIPAGTTVVIFQHDHFTGTSWTLTGDTPSFSALSPSANDQMSSVRIQ